MFFYKINLYLEIPCVKPANGETIVIETPHGVPVDIEPGLVQQLKGNLNIFCKFLFFYFYRRDCWC